MGQNVGCDRANVALNGRDRRAVLRRPARTWDATKNLVGVVVGVADRRVPMLERLPHS